MEAAPVLVPLVSAELAGECRPKSVPRPPQGAFGDRQSHELGWGSRWQVAQRRANFRRLWHDRL